MGDSVIDRSGMVHFAPQNLQNAQQNNMKAANSNCMADGESSNHLNISGTQVLDKGYLEYGCSHYRRRCRIRAPCCNEVFDCRHCHNDAKNNLNVDQKLRHDIPRHEVQQVICMLCGIEQEVGQICITCGVCMGRYFCGICKFYDDDKANNQFHCDRCGICRVVGREKSFHCDRCRCCYLNISKESHVCIIEGAMHHDCPVCFEYLFDSRSDIVVMDCGHTIHMNCLNEMKKHSQYACPLCCKSVCDMSRTWEQFDIEVADTRMPEPYQNKMVRILCNDCNTKSEVKFHIHHKCPNCNSYNTRKM